MDEKDGCLAGLQSNEEVEQFRHFAVSFPESVAGEQGSVFFHRFITVGKCMSQELVR